jgi:hypothetical protein
LRRFDRWLAFRGGAALRAAADPLVVDVGFGASPITTVELAHRLAEPAGFHGADRMRVVGVEIDPARVSAAQEWLGQQVGRGSVSFVRGGFEVPVAGAPILIRACNVLRQYRADQVRPAWELMANRLAPAGVLVEGTCDELGRLASWVTLTRPAGGGVPVVESLTLSADLAHLGRPGDLAARLPKVLIHDNVAGEPVHDWLAELDRQWDRAAGLAAFGPRQRWIAAVSGAACNWPVKYGPRRWRLGEVTVAWHAIAPSWE